MCRKYASLSSAVVMAKIGKAHVSGGLEAAVSADGGVNVRDDITGVVESG